MRRRLGTFEASEVRKRQDTIHVPALSLATLLNRSRTVRSIDDAFRSVHVGNLFSATAACSHQKKTKQIIKIKQKDLAAFLTRGQEMWLGVLDLFKLVRATARYRCQNWQLIPLYDWLIMTSSRSRMSIADHLEQPKAASSPRTWKVQNHQFSTTIDYHQAYKCLIITSTVFFAI